MISMHDIPHIRKEDFGNKHASEEEEKKNKQ
jgi:hypothetical protein